MLSRVLAVVEKDLQQLFVLSDPSWRFKKFNPQLIEAELWWWV